MKILYVAPEHVTGGFALFAKGHSLRGNECRWITFFQTHYDFQEDLCFNLWAMPNRGWVDKFRKIINRIHKRPDLPLPEGNPPIWKPGSRWEDALFRLRDLINTPRIQNTIRRWEMNEYDIYHFEQGIDPFRDGRWVKSLDRKGKGIVCFYHGTDVRNRGVIKPVHEVSILNLTSEIDLMSRIPGMKYLYLPVDTNELTPSPREPDGRIRICHAARNRTLKGSDFIENVVQELSRKYPVDWIMIENMPHSDALKLKAKCDICIDQITDLGGWGYGASSVEALALGLPTITRINDQVADFLGDHPFINAEANSLKNKLIRIIEDEALRKEMGLRGREWVVKRHGLDSVMETLYQYYRDVGLI